MYKLLIAFFVAAIFVAVLPTQADPKNSKKWAWPEKPENIKVLPKEWPGKRLAPVMKGFTRALGVRCSHCHVGEEGKPLNTYDFASDENPNKNRAREMLRMLGSINGHLDKVQPSGDKKVNMWCDTCHRGRPRPMTLEEELSETYRGKGLKAALDKYTELKEQFYGKGMYNFESESGLNSLGYTALGKEDFNGAIEVFEVNAKRFPSSANVWDSLAEGYLKAGNIDMARQYYQKSLILNPNNFNAKKMLKTIKGS